MQKLTKIADKSEYAWLEHCEAGGSDDEKRLYKAKLHAGRKLKATKQKRKLKLIEKT